MAEEIEIFEQHKAEIDAAFEEKGFFKRLSLISSGLSQPKSSAAYKIARTEIQRLAAPILAVVLPVVGVIVLIVITAVTSAPKETITVDIAAPVEDDPIPNEDPPEEPEEQPPEEMPDVVIDTPTVGPISDMTSPTPAPNEPVTVKPAERDSVALIKSPVTMKTMAGSRSPGRIGQMTGGGAGLGDAATERAVLMALRWLKKTQNKNGSWGNGTAGSKPACTGLAILSYLAHGETPASKEFGETVRRAIEYLVGAVSDGSSKLHFVGGDENGYTTMIGAYALCEAYGMTKNPNIKEPATRMLERIITGQNKTGGWDYKLPGNTESDDLSLGGWGLQALKAGKMAGLHPEGLEECIRKAIYCLKTRNYVKDRDYFRYRPDSNTHHPGLTATACLCMQLLGRAAEPEVRAALDYMREWKPSFTKAGLHMRDRCDSPQYYCYYATQCKYQSGMCTGATTTNVKSWQEWNVAMKKLYTTTIVDAGTIPGIDGKPKKIGYWKWGEDNWGKSVGGDTMQTCLCALQLMVYYRYLPTTQTSAAAVETDSSAQDGKKARKQEVEVDVDI